MGPFYRRLALTLVQMIIRAADLNDLDAIAEIQGPSSWRPEDFLFAICHVAVHNHEVVGFLAARQIVPGEREILFIAVHPAHRRQGIGRSLLLNEIAGAGAWFLEVRESNSAAINLYKSAGFQAVGVRENYYSDPCESAIVMRFFS